VPIKSKFDLCFIVRLPLHFLISIYFFRGPHLLRRPLPLPLHQRLKVSIASFVYYQLISGLVYMCIIFILFLDAAKKPATAAKIQLENASRDELVDFIKKQNQHIKTMETKSAGDGLI
jgi:hypothetical protein